MSDERRPIQRQDYDQLISVIYAMRAYLADPSMPFADVLELTQEQANISASEFRATAVTSEEYVKTELDQAARLVTALSRGETEITGRRRPGTEVCSVVGCPELTEFGLDVCMKHWGEQRGLPSA